MKILLLGSGGREHAIAWKLSQSPEVTQIYVSPGNGGTASLEKTSNIDLSLENNFADLIRFARTMNVGLVVPGSEQTIVEGIQDALKKAGIACFGPSKYGATLEGSKAFAKEFMDRYSIPTAEYKIFTDYDEAKMFIETAPYDVVIKASGLAAGKGVIVPTSKLEAIEAARRILVDKEFGGSGSTIVVEELLQGEECSVLAFSDGYTIVPFPAAQDHKRVFDNDEGPNTGGMGAYAPAVNVSDQLMAEIVGTILQPTIDGMRKEGYPYVGILFAGLMITSTGLKTLEFNCRFGDPETQVLLPLLDSKSDLLKIMMSCVNGYLDSVHLSFETRYSVNIVASSRGYPGKFEKGKLLSVPSNISQLKDCILFHAGTCKMEDLYYTAGGRVLSITHKSFSLEEAVDQAYAIIRSIDFEGIHFRKDIGHRGLKLLRNRDNKSSTYAAAGVSIENGNLLVEKLKSITKMTKRPGSDAEIGGFGGLFDLKSAGYIDPILVSSTDGVGTKLRIAHIVDNHSTIGIDLVAMNVNDLVVQGAEPLFFLDYYACSKLDVQVAREVVSGIATGCLDANCALIGGETAEMPGFYEGKDYDIGGFSVGAVERGDVLPRISDMIAGDLVLGIPSSGFHSNGYSLVRHIIQSRGLCYESPCPFNPTKTIADVLLTPTRIYVKLLLPLIKRKLLKGLSHITGGGFTDNIPRVLPPKLSAHLDAAKWPLSDSFKWIKKLGNVNNDEMIRTFNCGIGMIAIVGMDDLNEVLKYFINLKEDVYVIGHLRDIIEGEPRVSVSNNESW